MIADPMKVLKLTALHRKFGMQLLVNEPAHILPASYSWIDLIFVFQPNVVMESRVHLSLHQKKPSSDNIR